ncbi:SWIM zinc finger family protein [Jiangella asiatica]|uniref:Uncharacterized protein n=1 Tax=Jiangella asiatica TaxID=2530372 RepID=A0A4R5DLX2_9ACTN|nr:hypothetical protein [Jiangella asiatica]TDE13064.1 hypothetical protein E1269_06640 [Jiangella asiatica]
MATPSLLADAVRRRADPGAYERDRHYASTGLVRRLDINGNTVRVTVDGTYPYRVMLEISGTEITGESTCPYGCRRRLLQALSQRP